jgi:hypothetical protein
VGDGWEVARWESNFRSAVGSAEVQHLRKEQSWQAKIDVSHRRSLRVAETRINKGFAAVYHVDNPQVWVDNRRIRSTTGLTHVVQQRKSET